MIELSNKITGMKFTVSPGAKLSVPIPPMKSTPSTAVPAGMSAGMTTRVPSGMLRQRGAGAQRAQQQRATQ